MGVDANIAMSGRSQQRLPIRKKTKREQRRERFCARLYRAGRVGGRRGDRERAKAGRHSTRLPGHSMPDHDKYQLRPRAARSREPRARRAPQPLSKYRRKTANARERSRMREINRAFEALRRAVPAAAITGSPVPCEKLTKITTLRLAMRYIAALSAALRDGPEIDETPERWPSPLCSDLSELSTEREHSEFAEDSLSPFDTFFAEFDCVDIDRTFA
ncbi:unnamed protein product, partial [Iphiclides podalirius]